MKYKIAGRKILAVLLVAAMLLPGMPKLEARAADKDHGWGSITNVDRETKNYENTNEMMSALSKMDYAVVDLWNDWLETAKDPETDKHNADVPRIVIKKGATVTINMHGHRYSRAMGDYGDGRTSDGEVIWVGEGASLTINGFSDGDNSTTFNGYPNKDNVLVPYNTGGSLCAYQNKGIIMGGNSSNGAGGIHMMKNANVTLNNVVLAGNRTSNYGGAVKMMGNNILTLNNSNIDYNRAKKYAGGIYTAGDYCDIRLENGSTINHNLAKGADGGGIYLNEQYNQIKLGDDCTINNNEAGNSGGAIYDNDADTTIEMDNSATINENTAGDHGGAMFFNYSRIAITGGEISNNTAKGGSGGGIFFQHFRVSTLISTPSAALMNVTMKDNAADSEWGGAVYSDQENMVFKNCSFTGNHAVYGGALYLENDNNSISNTVVEWNFAKHEKGGGGVYIEDKDLALSGKVIIDKNSDKDGTSNLLLYDSGRLTSSPGKGSNVGISLDGKHYVIAPSGAHFMEKYFFSDKDGYRVVYKTKLRKLILEEGKPETIPEATETITSFKAEKDSTTINTKEIPDGYEGYPLYRGYFSYSSMIDGTTDLSAPFYYSDGYFLRDNAAKTYNEHLATMSLAMAMAAFNSSRGYDKNTNKIVDYVGKSANIKRLMADIGVKSEDIYLSDTYALKPTTSSIAVAIGQKPLYGKDGNASDRILVPIAVRGGGYESEWASNMAMGVSGEHEGFADAADQVTAQVKAYIQNHNLTQAVQQGKVSFWVVGYSRAGATANLTSKRLIDAYSSQGNQVFGYCMEAPQGGDPKEIKFGKYDSIFNCVNKDDPVPKVAPNLTDDENKSRGFHFIRYGQDKTFNSSDSKEEIEVALREKAIQRLKYIDPDIGYDDYFHVATINYLESTLLGYRMIDATSGGDKAPTTLGGFMDVFLDRLCRWAELTRNSYADEPTQAVIELTPGGRQKALTFQQALQVVVPLVFTKNSEELTNTLSERVNDLSMTNVYRKLIGEYHKMSVSQKSTWLWDTLWGTLVDNGKGTGISQYLTDSELASLKLAWPALLDPLLTSFCIDYETKDEIAPHDTQTIYGSLLYNASAMLEAHYQEVNFAWLSAMDDFYGKDENDSKFVTLKYDSSDSKEVGAYIGNSEDDLSKNENNTFTGSQALTLSTAESKTERHELAIYYRIKAGDGEYSVWKPYNAPIILEEPSEESGKTEITYSIEAKSVWGYGEPKVQTMQYKIKSSVYHTLTVVQMDAQNGDDYPNSEGSKTTTIMQYKEGNEVTVSLDTEPKKYYFTNWKLSEDTKDSLTGVDLNQPDLKFTMPNKDITLQACYRERMSYIDVEDLNYPTPGQKFPTGPVTINVSNSKNEEFTLSDCKVYWTKVTEDKDGKDGKSQNSLVTTNTAEYNTTYQPVLVVEKAQLDGTDRIRFASDVYRKTSEGNEEKITMETLQDGSTRLYWPAQKTGKVKLIAPIENPADITVSTGVAFENLPLQDHVLVQTDVGEKVVSVEWKSTDYDSMKEGTYTATGTVKLGDADIDKDSFNDTIMQTIKVETTKVQLAAPQANPASGNYEENKTVELTLPAGTNGEIYYKLETISGNGSDTETTSADGDEFSFYENPISLTLPTEEGTSVTYKITAYTKALEVQQEAQVSEEAYEMSDETSEALADPESDDIAEQDDAAENVIYTNSEEVTYVYVLTKPLPKYTVTIKCTDTGLADKDSGTKWSGEVKYTYTKGDKISIPAPELSHEQFDHWVVKKEDGIVTDNNKSNKLLQAEGTISGNIELEAVYNPVVTAIDLTIDAPVAGTKLAETAAQCVVTVDNPNDLYMQYGVTLPVTWSPAGLDGRAEAKSSYMAKLSMSMDSQQAKFYLASDLKLTVKDAKGNTVSSMLNTTEDDNENPVVEVYAAFPRTGEIQVAGIDVQEGLAVGHNATKKAIEEELAKFPVYLKLSDGTRVSASATWNVPPFDQKEDDQVIKATGTVQLPSGYAWAKEDSGSVTVKVNIAGADYVAAPTANRDGGSYMESQYVTLSCATEGATIYYTTADEEVSIDEKHKYDGKAIKLTESTSTLKAIAVKEGMRTSTQMSNTYYIHTHEDKDGDGKCDNKIVTGVDADGKEITEDCKTIFLGTKSGENDASYAHTAQASIYKGEGTGTIYVEVDTAYMTPEKNDETETETETTESESESKASESESGTKESETDTPVTPPDTGSKYADVQYSNDIYPATKLSFKYNDSQTHQYIFAGWYYLEKIESDSKDESGTAAQADETAEGSKETESSGGTESGTTTEEKFTLKPYKTMPTQKAYAKFVDASVLTVKAQITGTTTANSEQTDMRFLTSVDDIQYRNVGFKIKYNGQEKLHETRTVYKNVYASGELNNGNPVATDAKKVFDNETSNYFMAFRINQIPKKAFDVNFDVTPYWTTMDGTRVYGKMAVKTVNMGIKGSTESTQ